MDPVRKVPLYVPFLLALFATLATTIWLPSSRLLCFSPFLAILYQRTSLLKALWIASGCGLILDVTSAEWILGAHALNFCLTTFLLYKQKRHFFMEGTLSLLLFTALISFVSSLLYFTLSALFQRSSLFSFHSFLTELFLMPALDALYALVWFALPLKLFMAKKRIFR